MFNIFNVNIHNKEKKTTFKQWADFSPTCYPTLTGVLAQRRLQEEEWDATGEQKQNIRNEESPLRNT